MAVTESAVPARCILDERDAVRAPVLPSASASASTLSVRSTHSRRSGHGAGPSGPEAGPAHSVSRRCPGHISCGPCSTGLGVSVLENLGIVCRVVFAAAGDNRCTVYEWPVRRGPRGTTDTTDATASSLLSPAAVAAPIVPVIGGRVTGFRGGLPIRPACRSCGGSWGWRTVASALIYRTGQCAPSSHVHGMPIRSSQSVTVQ